MTPLSICIGSGRFRISFLVVSHGNLLQVNLRQKLLCLHQLTHNMTTDCGLVDARISASEKDLPVPSEPVDFCTFS